MASHDAYLALVEQCAKNIETNKQTNTKTQGKRRRIKKRSKNLLLQPQNRNKEDLC